MSFHLITNTTITTETALINFPDVFTDKYDCYAVTAFGFTASDNTVATNQCKLYDTSGSITTNNAVTSFIQLGTSSNRVSLQTNSPTSAFIQDLANSNGNVAIDPNNTIVQNSVAFSTTTAGVINFKEIFLDDIFDVNTTNALDGQVLTYVGGSINE